MSESPSLWRQQCNVVWPPPASPVHASLWAFNDCLITAQPDTAAQICQSRPLDSCKAHGTRGAASLPASVLTVSHITPCRPALHCTASINKMARQDRYGSRPAILTSCPVTQHRHQLPHCLVLHCFVLFCVTCVVMLVQPALWGKIVG